MNDLPEDPQTLAQLDQWNSFLREQTSKIQVFMADPSTLSVEGITKMSEDLVADISNVVGYDAESLGKFTVHCLMALAYNVPQPLLRFPF